MNILVLTDVLPAPILSNKIRENDVLLTTAEMHERRYNDVKYTFVFVVNVSILSLIHPKLKEYLAFKRLKRYTLRGREVEIVAVPFLRGNFLRAFFLKVGFLINKKKLAKIINREKIDIIHAQNIISDAGLAFNLNAKFGIPYVITTRRIGLSKLDKDIEQAMFSAGALINLGYPQKRMTQKMNNNNYVIPHGIDGRFLKKQKLYNPYSISPLKIVTIARLLDWKNIDKVLLALDKVKGEFIYDIYGEGPMLNQLQSLVSRLSIDSKVNFKGHISYEIVPDTLSEYDIFVLPSFKEHFGRVYIEAMACGLPVIGAKNTGVDGYIEPGVHGFLVDHTNVVELRHIIERFMAEPTLIQNMGMKAKALSDSFSWAMIVERLDKVYRSSLIDIKSK